MLFYPVGGWLAVRPMPWPFGALMVLLILFTLLGGALWLIPRPISAFF